MPPIEMKMTQKYQSLFTPTTTTTTTRRMVGTNLKDQCRGAERKINGRYEVQLFIWAVRKVQIIRSIAYQVTLKEFYASILKLTKFTLSAQSSMQAIWFRMENLSGCVG
jgi:hypothetical protein